MPLFDEIKTVLQQAINLEKDHSKNQTESSRFAHGLERRGNIMDKEGLA